MLENQVIFSVKNHLQINKEKTVMGKGQKTFAESGKKTESQKMLDRHTKKFISSVVDCLPDVDGTTMQGWIGNPKALHKALKNALVPPNDVQSTTLFSGNEYLLPVPPFEGFGIEACEGGYVLANDAGRFLFKCLKKKDAKYGEWVPATPKPAVLVGICLLAKNATLYDLFCSVTYQPEKIAFSFEQMERILSKDELSKEGPVLFLCHNAGKICVTNVHFVGKTLKMYAIDIFSLNYQSPWNKNDGFRIVIPRIINK